MDSENKGTLEEIYKLTKENNKMLHRIQSSRRWSKFGRVLYWMALIVVTVIGYYYLEPYLKTLQETYQTLQQSVSDMKAAGDTVSEAFKGKN